MDDAAEYRMWTGKMALTHMAAARVLGVDVRTSRRWADGSRAVPTPVLRLLWACERDRALLALLLTADD